MRNFSTTLCVMIFVVTLDLSASLPVEQYSDDQLSSELQKLKSLLQNLETQKHQDQEKYVNKDMGPPPTVTHGTEEYKDEDEIPVDNGRLLTSEEEKTAKKKADIRSFVESLSPEDLSELKVLKKMVDKAKGDVDKKSVDVKNQEPPKTDDSEPHVEAEVEEGTFGPFRDEIKYSIEKNLLSDMALALHSGIKVDEILQDLVPSPKEEVSFWERSAEEEK